MEAEELLRGDPAWWPDLLAAVAEGGREGLQRERLARGWGWGALWGWIVSDDERRGEYQRALEAYVQDKALETIGIADGAGPEDVAAAKLQVDTRFRLAGKVDRARWGEKVEVEHRGVPILRIELGPMAQALPLSQEKVVESLTLEQEPVAADTAEEGFI